jgi:hypothetical protein
MCDFTIELQYADACLPDYFNGTSKPCLSIPVDGNTTRKEIYDNLLSEYNTGIADYRINEFFESNGYLHVNPYVEVKQAIYDCIYHSDKCMGNDKVFPSLECYNNNDFEGDSVYAYFIISVTIHETISN